MEISTPSLESIWLELRPHLEWANGFNLVFLFADNPGPVGLLRQRFDDSLHLRTLRLCVMDPSSPEELTGLAELLLTHRAGFGPLWVELWRQGEDPAWRRARIQLLHQLNERRSVLEREIRQPVVLVLPLAERGNVYTYAPDLWAVRSFTARLPTVAPTHPSSIITREIEFRPAMTLGSGPSPAEQEWARMLDSTVKPIRLNPWDGIQAFTAAMARGDLQASHRIATETLNLAREQIEHDDGGTSQRNLSVSLDNVGQVEADLGNLEPARTAYRESLELRRQLRQAFPDHAQLQRDLSWMESRWNEFVSQYGA